MKPLNIILQMIWTSLQLFSPPCRYPLQKRLPLLFSSTQISLFSLLVAHEYPRFWKAFQKQSSQRMPVLQRGHSLHSGVPKKDTVFIYLLPIQGDRHGTSHCVPMLSMSSPIRRREAHQHHMQRTRSKVFLLGNVSVLSWKICTYYITERSLSTSPITQNPLSRWRLLKMSQVCLCSTYRYRRLAMSFLSYACA